jgi:uncharacterized protein YndB with AHSA1/START domain
VSEIRIVRDYAYPVTRVWRALTDSDLIPLWTATGAGGRPEGFAPVPGTRFRFVARPKPGWNGIVNCEVVEAREPTLLRYTWADDAGGDTTVVTYSLEPAGDGTRFTYEHTGFTGIGGLFMARMLGRIRYGRRRPASSGKHAAGQILSRPESRSACGGGARGRGLEAGFRRGIQLTGGPAGKGAGGRRGRHRAGGVRSWRWRARGFQRRPRRRASAVHPRPGALSHARTERDILHRHRVPLGVGQPHGERPGAGA